VTTSFTSAFSVLSLLLPLPCKRSTNSTSQVPGGSVRLEIAPRLLTRYERVSRNLAIEHELFGRWHHPIQYRERSDRIPALNDEIAKL